MAKWEHAELLCNSSGGTLRTTLDLSCVGQIKGEDVWKELKKLGEDGWELVSAVALQDPPLSRAYCFKRPKP